MTSQTGSYFVVWEDFRNGSQEYADVYIQSLSGDVSQFGDDGAVVCDAFHNQVNPQIDLLSDGVEDSYLIYWNDMRSSGKEDLINVFAQKLVVADCNGDDNGTAYIDSCGDCISGNTGNEENYADLGCGCDQPAPLTYFADADGDGDGDPNNFQTLCEDPGTGWVTNSDDDDDVCVGSVDDCGVCNGENADQDCFGACFGNATIDACEVCDDDLTNDDVSCTGCMDLEACNYDQEATIAGGCEYPTEGFDCDGNSLSNENLIPEEYDLEQNYPNPFNPSTVISFSLPEYTQVSLLVYDVNGKVVSTLVSDALSPGVYHYNWYGKNDNGYGLSSGIFFYVLQTDTYLQKRKMVYIK
jgi:hypothetical protein